MKAHYFSLLLGALVLAATLLPQAVQAQTVCIVTSDGYEWTLQLNNNFLTGSIDLGTGFLWEAIGTSGPTGELMPVRRTPPR